MKIGRAGTSGRRHAAHQRAVPLNVAQDGLDHGQARGLIERVFDMLDHVSVTGGMNKKGAGLPAWLVAANAEARAAAQESLRQRRPKRRVHCWVHGSAADHPGLVLDWKRVGAGWMAHVAWTTGGGDIVCTWVEAETITPVAIAERAAN